MATCRPLVVIVGPTASGKSALALELARKFNGEIIAADSRTVYKGMDIGTAKPTREERSRVPHHLLDVAEPNEKFSVADFKETALKAIEDITDRNKLPIMVGGSGLYVDAVLFDYSFASPEQAQMRDPSNPRHLDRSIESSKRDLRPDTLVIGLKVEREELKKRITARVDRMIEDGLLEEIEGLGKRHGWEVGALQAPAYKAFRKYLDGIISLDEAKNEFIRQDMNLAKRQMTWFKRNNSIHWLSDPSKVVDIVTTFLNKINC